MNLDLLRRISSEFERVEHAVACGESIALDHLFDDLSEEEREIALREVQELLEELHQSNDRFSPLNSASSLSSRYEPIEPINQGGMGEIWIALDNDFHRQVAIKEIRTSAANDTSLRQRFLREAEITARLEHPGILPVYGKGVHADGRPYYAMRWVSGEGSQTLHEAIQALHSSPSISEKTRQLQFHELIRRFISVCQTIAFAHHANIIHRDLKPANIMLGPFGETFVVDWGLAWDLSKAESVESELSSVGEWDAFCGTPGFVAPECLIDPKRTDHRSDIYSLGLILHHLCVGSSPFSKTERCTPEKLKSAILEGRITRLRQIAPRLHPALEAICQKATATDPTKRYESAQKLAEDMNRYLSDEPTSAWPESRRYRIRRGIQRHLASVAAVFVAILLSLVGSLGFSWLSYRHNIALSRKSSELEESLRAEAKYQREVLELAELASNREELARQAIATFASGVADDPRLRFSEEFQDLRRSLLERPMEYYRQLTDSIENSGKQSAESLARTLDARLELAKLQLEGGELASARGNFERILKETEEYLAATPDAEARWVYRQALALTTLARIYAKLGDRAAEKAALEKFESLQAEISQWAEIPESLEVILAERAMETASKLAEQNETERALALASDARRRVQKLAERFSDDKKYIVLKEKFLNDAALISLRAGDLSTAESQFQELLERLRASAANAAEKPPSLAPRLGNSEIYNRQFRQAAVEFNLGIILQTQGELPRALKNHQEALQLRLRLVEQLPSVSEFLRTLGHSYLAISNLQMQLNDSSQGIENYRNYVDVNRQMFRRQPARLPQKMDLIISLHQLGHFEQTSGNAKEAIVLYLEALPLTIEILEAAPEDPIWRRHRIDLSEHLGMLYFEQDRFVEAQSQFDQAFEGQQQYATQANATSKDRATFRAMLMAMIKIAERLEQTEKLDLLKSKLQAFESDP